MFVIVIINSTSLPTQNLTVFKAERSKASLREPDFWALFATLTALIKSEVGELKNF